MFTGGGGAGSAYVPTFVAVVVNSVSFNWDPGTSTQDGMTLKEDLPANATIPVPEWQLLPSRNYAAAYWGGTRPIIEASISVYPPTASVAIQPRSEKCPTPGAMPTCFPPLNGQIVSGSSMKVDIPFANDLPSRVFPIMDSILWYSLSPENGKIIKRIRLRTGPHSIYVLDPYRPPVDLMEHPLAEVLRYSTYLVSSDYYSGINDSDLLKSLGRNLYRNAWKDDPDFGNMNYIAYDALQHKYILFFGFSSYFFHIMTFLDDLRLSQNGFITADCWTVAGFYKSLANSLGVNSDILEFSGSLDTVSIWPIGHITSESTVHWDTHATTVYPNSDGNIYEATFELYNYPIKLELFDKDKSYYKSHVFITPINDIAEHPQTIYLDY